MVEAFLFLLGAVGAFALVGVASFGRPTARVRIDARQPVGVAIGAATAIDHLLEDGGAWAIGGFAATLSYLVLLAVRDQLTCKAPARHGPSLTANRAVARPGGHRRLPREPPVPFSGDRRNLPSRT
jgi:hypothetical protein